MTVWTKTAGTEWDNADSAAIMVRACVAWRRWFGRKSEHAQEAAAQALSLTPRRVRAFCREEVTKVAAIEFHAIRAACRRDREAHIAELIDRAAQLERDALCDVDGQFSLPFGNSSVGGASMPRSDTVIRRVRVAG